MEKFILHTISSEGPFQLTPVSVECVFRKGIPGLQLTGVAAGDQKETTERIRSALYSCGFVLPYSSITVNLAPADQRKRGSQMDLAIALAILLNAYPELKEKVSDDIDLTGTVFIGELSLYGDLRPVQGVYGFMELALANGFKSLCLPAQSVGFTKPENFELLGVRNLNDLFDQHTTRLDSSASVTLSGGVEQSDRIDSLRLSDRMKRAMCVSSAGWHSMLLIGPPGSGKSSCAREMIHLLPEPDDMESIELLGLYQRLYGEAKNNPRRPMRMPHHSVTARALIGGGIPIEPGEATRAHNGILILEELSEFGRSALQSLREAVEDRSIHIARGSRSIRLPSRFLLIATTNPCSCGNLGSVSGRCFCTKQSIDAYRRKIEGPLRDRIDMELFLDRIDIVENSLTSTEMKSMIMRAVTAQKKRYASTDYRFNSDVGLKDLDRFCPLPLTEGTETSLDLSRFSHRVIHSVRKTARTVADLSGSEQIREEHFLEALSYRTLNLYDEVGS